MGMSEVPLIALMGSSSIRNTLQLRLDLIREHLLYSTDGSVPRMPAEAGGGTRRADATVDDSNAAAFAKPRMLGGASLLLIKACIGKTC